MRLTAALLAPLAATLTVGSANAATISFTDYDATEPAVGITVDGVGVTATAATWTQDSLNGGSGTGRIDRLGPLFDTAELDLSRFGLAVNSSLLDTDHRIDGFWFSDLVLFEFDEAVRLTGLSFNYANDNSQFVLFTADASGALTLFEVADVLAGTVTLDMVGSAFGIGAIGAHSAFKLDTLSFDAAPVPLPAAAPLFAGAALLGGLARRRARG